MNDVWLLDIFDWRRRSGQAAAEATGAARPGDTNMALSGAAAGGAGAETEVSLCWTVLDFSASPLKPPGRFLHSCSVFFKADNDSSCCFVRPSAAADADDGAAVNATTTATRADSVATVAVTLLLSVRRLLSFMVFFSIGLWHHLLQFS